MAATVSGAFPVCLDQERPTPEDVELKKKQVALMEKLRSKRSPQHRSWTDSLMKSFRSSVVDRKLHSDSSERNQVQKCLYTLQRAMKVISQQSLLERLEGVARHQGLTFGVSGSDPPSITLQADMFHIEIVLIKGGGIKEVKIAHQGEASVCHELTDILCRGDFPEFTSHLEGLQSIYGVTGEKKLKSKVFLALQSLEKDLNDLAQFQSSISGVANYIHKSPLGILLPRTAGKPMKLIYFVSPYDLLDKKTMSAHPMTVEAITEHGLGRSVTVCLESGPASKLQTMPLLSVAKNLPSFIGLTHANSANLPASFVLVLPQPIPVAMSVLRNIQHITEVDTGKQNGSQSLLSLILDSNSGGKMKNDHQLFVSLPDQHHRYFINSVSGGVLDEPSVMLSRIPFSHPTHVPKILTLLRKQLLFNSLLASCVRPAAKKDSSCSLVFEMTVISLTQMMVVFEHPAHDTMVTMDIDMSDLTSLKCRMLSSNDEHSLCSDDMASLILQRCLSLPILLRALVRRGRSQLEKLIAEAKALAEEQARLAREAAMWAAAQRQQQARMPPSIPTKGRPPPPQPPPLHLTPTYPPTPSPITSNPPSVGDLHRMNTAVDLLSSSPPGYPVNSVGIDTDCQDKKNNPLLVNLLDSERLIPSHPITSQLQQQSSLQQHHHQQHHQQQHHQQQHHQQQHHQQHHLQQQHHHQHQQQQQQQQQQQGNITESPMLSKLLEDHISVATNVTPIVPSPALPQQHQVKPKVTKGRKRRMQGDLMTGRSPKQRVSDGDISDRYTSLDFDSSSSPFESSLGASGSMSNFHHPMGPTPPRPASQGHMSGVIDLTEENMPESSLKKLVDFSMDNIPAREMKPGGATESELHALLSQRDHSNSPVAAMKPNQVPGSKNESAPTSPEGLLTGSGEVGKASLPDPAAVYPKVRTTSRSSPPAAMVPFLGHGQGPPKARIDSEASGLHQQSATGLSTQQDMTPMPQQLLSGGGTGVRVSEAPAAMTVSRPKVVSSSSMTEALDIKPTLPPAKKVGGMKTTPSAEYVVDKRGLFEKFDFTGQSASSTHVTITSSTVSTSSVMEGEDLIAPKVRLKLHPFRSPQNKSQSFDSGVIQSPSSAGSKSSNSNTFDFRSDEEDDEPMSMSFVPSERHSVYSSSSSASSTPLHMSAKGKVPTPVSTPETPPVIKPEKYKRREKSSGTTKRKKDKEESKKEKKKKKMNHDLYVETVKEPMYRASTIEGDQKSGTKLKIRVSKEHIKMPSPIKESGRMDLNPEKVGKFSEKVNDVFKKRSVSSPTVEKLVLQKQETKEQTQVGPEIQKDVSQLYRSSVSTAGKMIAKPATSGSKVVVTNTNNTLSKSDPKLAKATIRLKPLNMSSSTSTSVTVTPPVKTLSSGRSMSDRCERRQSSSTPTAVTTPTSSTMSLASILPNAPTASSVASLPPIPKRPKVSTVNAAASSTTTVTSAKSTSPVVNSNSKSSPLNSAYNNSMNKLSGNSSGVGSRPGSNPNISNAHKTPGMGFNKTGTPPGILKNSPNNPAHKVSRNSSMPPGILKNSGNVSQGNINSPKTNVGNQVVQKSSGTSNQSPNNSFNRGSHTQAGGPQKQVPPGHGMSKNMSSQGGNVLKGSGNQGNMSRGLSSGNQNFQKGSVTNQGGSHKPSNLANQTSNSPGQNQILQKSGSQGKGAMPNSVNSMHRPVSHGGAPGQGNTTNSVVPKLTTSMSSGSSGGGQKLPGNQARSVSTSNSSPSSTNRSPVNVRGSSVSSATTGPKLPPNHLSVNRSTPVSGQKGVSGSSPRTSSGQSPSNPSAPRLSSGHPQQKSLGSSPSSATPRPGSASQASSQRSSSSSQSSSNPKSSSMPSQRPSTSSPQMQRSGSTSSPSQRPASTPGPTSEGRPASTGASQSQGHPVRPSSAGPRQGSSPLGSRQTSSPGQRLISSPGGRTSSPNGQGQRSGSAGVSPLATSRQSPTADVAASRQNSAGSLNPPIVSRQNSTGNLNSATVSRQNSASNVNRASVSKHASVNSGNSPLTSKQNSSGNVLKQTSNSGSATAAGLVTSRQSSTANSSTTVVSRQNSNNALNSSILSQTSNSKSAAPLVRQNSSNNLKSSPVVRPTSSSAGSASVTQSSKQSVGSSSKTVSTSVTSQSSSSECITVSRQTGITSTSGKQLSSGSITSSASVSSSRTPGAVTSSTQRTSSGSSVLSAGGSKGNVTKPSLSGPSNAKSTGGAVIKGANAGKTNATTSIAGGKAAVSSATLPSVSAASSVATVGAGKGGTGTSSAVTPASAIKSSAKSQSSSSFTPSTKAPVSTSSVSSSSSSSSVSSHLPLSASSKCLSSGAARGRKGSLSAIVDKLATKMNATPGPAPDSGDNSRPGAAGAPVASVSEMSAGRRRSAMEEGESTELKVGVKRSSSVSGLPPSSSEQKVPRVDSRKPVTSTFTTITSSPLPAHTTPPHSSPSLSAASSGVERHRSGSVGEKGNSVHSRDTASIGLDLSMPKDKTTPSASAMLHLDSRGRVSPKEYSASRSVSPASGSDRAGTKFNGDASKDRPRSETEIFKVPTPKHQSEDFDDRNDYVSSRQMNMSNSRPPPAPSSPLSDASSPGNDLVIDCGEVSTAASSRMHLSSKGAVHPGHKGVADRGIEGIDRASPVTSVGKASPSANARSVKSSPLPSPHSKLSSSQHSPDSAVTETRANSPCEIDDDLMDAALMGFGAS